MKKEKFAFWLIGFGCGIMLVSLLGTVFALKAGSMRYEMQSERDQTVYYEEVDESKEQAAGSNEANEEETEENKIKDEAAEVISEVYKEVYIPSYSTASGICRILEENGIIEDGNDFLDYIKKYKLQTKLKTGNLSLPVHAEYEILLNLLVV